MWPFTKKKKKENKVEEKECCKKKTTEQVEEKECCKKAESVQVKETEEKAPEKVPVEKTSEKKVAKKDSTEKKSAEKKTTEKKAEKVEEQKVEPEQVESESKRKAIYRVTYDKERKLWLIRKDGAKRVIKTCATKEEALTRAKQLSENNETGLIVHKKDGKFQKKRNS